MTTRTTVIIAYRDGGSDMTPVARNGTLALFATIAAARSAAGTLGVAAPIFWSRVSELCRQHNLALPERPNGRLEQMSLEMLDNSKGASNGR